MITISSIGYVATDITVSANTSVYDVRLAPDTELLDEVVVVGFGTQRKADIKDAASSSIYGSRAAFGVILITTKRGHAGKTSVSYSGNVRYSGPARLPDLMNSWDFANYFNEANANAGQAAVFNDETLGRIQAFIAGEIPLYEGVDGKFRPQTTIANGKLAQLTSGSRSVTKTDNIYLLGSLTFKPLKGWNIYAQAGYPAGSTEAWQYMRRDNHLTASLYSDYTLNLNGHNMNVMAGISIEDYNDRYMGISRPDFITVGEHSGTRTQTSITLCTSPRA